MVARGNQELAASVERHAESPSSPRLRPHLMESISFQISRKGVLSMQGRYGPPTRLGNEVRRQGRLIRADPPSRCRILQQMQNPATLSRSVVSVTSCDPSFAQTFSIQRVCLGGPPPSQSPELDHGRIEVRSSGISAWRVAATASSPRSSPEFFQMSSLGQGVTAMSCMVTKLVLMG